MRNKVVLLSFVLFAAVAQASSRELVKYVPEYSFHLVGADLIPLRDNEIFLSMEQKGQIWSYEDDSQVANYFRILKIDPKKDINNFVFAKYLNSYGSSGKLHIFELGKEISPVLQEKPTTKYLDSLLYRLDPNLDWYAVLLQPTIVAFGNLNEAKMALDLARGKLADLTHNAELNSLFQKLPSKAPVWGLASPLSRRKAAAARAQQTTNALLQGFQTYYFYAVPSKNKADSHFYGQTGDEKQATLASAFMIGTLTFAKFRADESLAEMLDQVDIQHNGNTVHVSAVVTREMVDAYFNGDLGIK